MTNPTNQLKEEFEKLFRDDWGMILRNGEVLTAKIWYWIVNVYAKSVREEAEVEFWRRVKILAKNTASEIKRRNLNSEQIVNLLSPKSQKEEHETTK